MLWNNRTNLAAGINLESLIENIIFAKASWHLWFFAIIIQFYILYPFILKLYKTLKEKQRQAVFLLIIAALQILWNLSKNSLFIPSIDIPLFFSHIIYFGAGIFVKDNYEKIKSTLKKLKTINLIFILLIINCISVAEAALALFSGYSYYEIPYYFYILDIFITPVMYLMQIVLLYRLSDYLYKKKSSIATITYSLGKHSFGIYLIHVIFLNVSGKLIKVLMHIDHNYFMFYVLLFIGTLILSYGTIYILSFMPYSELIVGIYKNYGNK
jgi:peptidoglycan/LPS O-acetylase OafA/YrhL